MADQDRPNQNANKSKAEGERIQDPERNSARKGDRDTQPERQYNSSDAEDAGGITNRPLSDERENQASLPERGTKRDQTRDPGARRPEGDYQEEER